MHVSKKKVEKSFVLERLKFSYFFSSLKYVKYYVC